MPDGFLISETLYSGSASSTVLSRPHSQFPHGSFVGSDLFGGSMTNTQPVVEKKDNVSGSVQNCFGFMDWYERTHVIPRSLNLGNLLSVQIRQIQVWNAYTTTLTLLDIEETGTTGITLQQPMEPPVIFSPLSMTTYSVRVDTVGPPIIDGAYTFNFNTLEHIEVPVFGKRVVVWPFVPQDKYTETLEWKTDILKSRVSEQRQALRKQPRQSFDYEFWMNDRNYSIAKAIAYGWSHRTFGVPVWGEYTKLGAVVSGTEVLNFNTSNADYRENDVILLWESDEKFEACEVLSIAAGALSLKLPVVGQYTNAYVMPMRYGRALNGFEASRDANHRIISRVSFEVTSNTDIGASIGLPQYKTLDVLTDTNMKVGDHSEKVMREVTVIDNGVSVPTTDATYGFTHQWSTMSWNLKTRAELWRVRKWLHARKGACKSFWLPSNLKDVSVVADLTTSTTTLTIEPIGYPLYYGERHVMIMTKSGNRYYKKVTGSTTNEDGTETLFLDETIGANISVSQISYVCFMMKCRLEADRVEIQHGEGSVTISVPIVEVPE